MNGLESIVQRLRDERDEKVRAMDILRGEVNILQEAIALLEHGMNGHRASGLAPITTDGLKMRLNPFPAKTILFYAYEVLRHSDRPMNTKAIAEGVSVYRQANIDSIKSGLYKYIEHFELVEPGKFRVRGNE